MSVRIHPKEPERSLDLNKLTEDDLLLDQLGRGEVVSGEVETILSGWRASLPEPGPISRRQVGAALAAVRSRRMGRLARVTVGVAIGVMVAGGGVAVAAANAGPDSPLWPVTQLVYRDLAESRMATRAASETVAKAEKALQHGDVDKASRLLDQAATQLREVSDPEDADALRDRLDAVRGRLPSQPPLATPGLPKVPGATLPDRSSPRASEPPPSETVPAPSGTSLEPPPSTTTTEPPLPSSSSPPVTTPSLVDPPTETSG